MPERFSPLPDEAFIFRLVDPGSRFLPADAQLPIPDWFEPSSTDKEEGERRGRNPGLSVWDQAGASVENARHLTGRANGIAFGLSVDDCKRIGQSYERVLSVVADPLDARAPTPGWDAHSLVEGLKRPPHVERRVHKDLLAELAHSCQKVA